MPTKKVLVVGATAVGKTCLIKSIMNEPLDRVYVPTQDDWYSTVLRAADGKEHKIQIYDTGGYDAFPELAHCYIKKANLIVVVMEFNNNKSTAMAVQIVNNIKKIRGDIPLLSVTSKCDQGRCTGQLQSCGASEHIISSSMLNIGISEVKSFIRRNLHHPAANPAAAIDTYKQPTSSCHGDVKQPKSSGLKLPFTKNLLSSAHHKQAVSTSDLSYAAAAGSSPLSSPSVHRQSTYRARCNSQPESVLLKGISNKGGSGSSSTHTVGSNTMSESSSSLVGSSTPSSSLSRSFYKLSAGSHMSSEQLNRIYEKYGYQRKISAPVSPSPSLNNVASSIRRSTNSIVKSVQNAISKLNT